MPDSPPPGASGAPPLTGLITAVVALGPLTMSMYAPSMPAIAESFGASAGAVQLTLSVYLVGFALAQLVYGPMSDRFGRRGVLGWGLAVYVAGSAACGLAPSIGALIAARAVQAAGACAGPAIGRAMVRDLYARERAARVLALVGLALAVAPAVGPLAGGYLQVWLGWQAIFVALGAAGALLLALVLTRLPETNPHRDRDALQPRRLAGNYAALMRNRNYLGYLGPAAVTLGGLFTYHANAPFVLIEGVGLSPTAYGWTMIPTVASYVAGSWAAGRFTERAGIDRLIAAGGVLTVLGAGGMFGFVAAGIVSVPTVIGPMMLWTLGMGLALPAAMAGGMAPFPRMAGTASALMGFWQMGTGAIGSIAVARLGNGAPLVWTAAMLALGAGGFALYYALVWRRRGAAGNS